MKSIKKWESAPSDEDAHMISGTFQDGILDIYTTHCAREEPSCLLHEYYLYLEHAAGPKSLETARYLHCGRQHAGQRSLILVFGNVMLVEQRDTNAHTSTVNNQTELSRPELLISRSNVPRDATPKKRRLPDSNENLSLKRPKT